MRGSVSVALVYHFFEDPESDPHVASIIAMTIIVVVTSTILFGAATKPLLDLMLGKSEAGCLSGLPPPWSALPMNKPRLGRTPILRCQTYLSLRGSCFPAAAGLSSQANMSRAAIGVIAEAMHKRVQAPEHDCQARPSNSMPGLQRALSVMVHGQALLSHLSPPSRHCQASLSAAKTRATAFACWHWCQYTAGHPCRAAKLRVCSAVPLLVCCMQQLALPHGCQADLHTVQGACAAAAMLVEVYTFTRRGRHMLHKLRSVCLARVGHQPDHAHVRCCNLSLCSGQGACAGSSAGTSRFPPARECQSAASQRAVHKVPVSAAVAHPPLLPADDNVEPPCTRI